MLNWLNDTFRPVHVQGADGEDPAVDKTTALTVAGDLHREGPMFGGGPVAMPPDYVASQQDERPR
jgi:hypothetical protein